MDIACSLLVLIANNRFGRYKMSQSNLSIALCIAIVKFNMWKYLSKKFTIKFIHEAERNQRGQHRSGRLLTES